MALYGWISLMFILFVVHLTLAIPGDPGAFADRSSYWLVELSAILGLLHFLLYLVCLILTMIWIFRSYANLLHSGISLDNSPGMAVGWFFVPVMNAWKPYIVLRQLWQGSQWTWQSARQSSAEHDGGWRTMDVSPLIGLFWVLVLCQLFLSVLGFGFHILLAVLGPEYLHSFFQVPAVSGFLVMPIQVGIALVLSRITVQVGRAQQNGIAG